MAFGVSVGGELDVIGVCAGGWGMRPASKDLMGGGRGWVEGGEGEGAGIGRDGGGGHVWVGGGGGGAGIGCDGVFGPLGVCVWSGVNASLPVCVRVHACVRACLSVCGCMRVCMRACLCVCGCMHACVYACLCVCVCVCGYMHACTHACTRTHTDMHTHAHTPVWVRVHACVRACVCVCVRARVHACLSCTRVHNNSTKSPLTKPYKFRGTRTTRETLLWTHKIATPNLPNSPKFRLGISPNLSKPFGAAP